MKKDIEWLREEIYALYPSSYSAYVLKEPDKLLETEIVDKILELIDQLDEPEKVVIPKFVSDWIDAHNLYGNNPLREYRDLEKDFNEGWTDEKDAAVYHWVNENPYAFIDALRYGYEVEKEPHYYVAFEGEFNLLYVTHVDIYGEDGKFNYSSVFDKKHALKFTDKSKAEYLADFLGAIVVEATQ